MPMTFKKMRASFEAFASGKAFDLAEHPLHALYLNPTTQAAWEGWKNAHVTTGAYLPDGSPPMVPASGEREALAMLEECTARAKEQARRLREAMDRLIAEVPELAPKPAAPSRPCPAEGGAGRAKNLRDIQDLYGTEGEGREMLMEVASRYMLAMLPNAAIAELADMHRQRDARGG